MKRRTRRMWILVLASACLLVLLPAAWCWFVPLKTFRPSHAPSSFPETEIIYNAGAKLGFVNADGSGVTTVPFTLGYTDFVGTWQSPLLTGDGKTILVTYTAVPGYGGKIYALLAGEKATDCGLNGTIQIAADGSHILVNTGNIIEKYLPEDCGTKNPPEKVYRGNVSSRASLSPDEQYIAEVRSGEKGAEEYIVIRYLETGEERNLGNGDFPVWSRDGRWLAYTGADGIYIIQISPDVEPRRLVTLKGPNPNGNVLVYQEDLMEHYYPPIASWSSDGHWLAYHVYSSNPVNVKAEYWAKYYSIFKANMETGETIKLIDGGYSPSWRWPAQP